jgi:glycosyltransferase involved in cell wall biosynthesis
MTTKFSVVIPVRNDGEILRRCLESLSKSDYPGNLIEIIVADGLSTDDTAAVAASYGARVIANEKKIVAPARNIGFAASTGEIVAFIDADCVLDAGWVWNSSGPGCRPHC